ICPPPCECIDCLDQFYDSREQKMPQFAYTRKVSDVEAKKILGDFVAGICSDRQFLQKQCNLYGDIIMNRWKRKTQGKREACLLRVDPDLYQHQWFIPRYTNTRHHWKESRKFRNSFLLPNLNVPVLKNNPSTFLALLHYRTFYSPQDWAPYDNRQLIISWACGTLDVEYSESCVIMYGLQYGQLTPWVASLAHRSDIIGFPRARLILEAQAHLMQFLRKMVEQILQGTDLEIPGSCTKWLETTQLGFRKLEDVAFWSPYTNQPFSAPPIFNIDFMLSLAKGRMDATGDHLLLLQADAPYMRRHIELVKECQVINEAQREIACLMVVQDLFRDINVHLYWKSVFDEFEHLNRCYVRFRDHIHPGEQLPTEYDKALGALELLLVNAMHSRSKHLQAIIPQRPGFCQSWEFKEDPETGQIKMARKDDTTITELFYKDPLEWCLLQLQGEPDAQRRFDHALLFAFLEEHVSTCESSDRARLDETLYKKLSDYAAIHELLAAVRLHRPQNTNRDIDDVHKNDNRKAWRYDQRHPEIAGQDSLDIAAALKAFCDAPLPAGEIDHTWLQRSGRVRKTLEAFWNETSRRWRRSFKKAGYSADEVRSELDFFSVYDSPGYVQDVKAERANILTRIGNAAGARIKLPRSQSWQAEQEVKAKVKTRSDRPANIQQLEGEADGPATQGPERKILASRRAFGVFSLMFPASGEEAATSVDWDVFVRAMADVGFSATNSSGSAVDFEKKDDSDAGHAGKIVFHKPHPASKIHPVMLRSMGKRMTKWFGWHRELFALR
ncbi:hypothetical protein AOQ84DRAFT_268717, partial [Glonium stellatum]